VESEEWELRSFEAILPYLMIKEKNEKLLGGFAAICSMKGC